MVPSIWSIKAWFLPLGVLTLTGLCLTAFTPLVLAWDGDWTNASSGKREVFDDPDSSHGKAGSDPPQKFYPAQKFYIPNPRDYADVDPEELDDYYKRYRKDYAPYALARIFQNIRYNQIVLDKGYYLIKPGDINDGSPRVNLQSAAPKLDPDLTEGSVWVNTNPATQADGLKPAVLAPAAQSPGNGNHPPMGALQTAPPAQSSPPTRQKTPYRVFVIKKQGKVFAVVPIHRMEPYRPKRKEQIPKHALAWVEEENRHPVLKFYYKKWIYSTDFQ